MLVMENATETTQTVWATQRKLLYALLFSAAIIVLAVIPSFFIFYKAPSCVDNKQNQGEQGVDCGGPCSILCQAKQRDPVVVWAQKFLVRANTYSAVAYIENPNVTAEASHVPYIFRLFDDSGTVIAEKLGETFVPPHKKFAVFEGNIPVTSGTPSRITFEFTGKPFWKNTNTAQNKLSVGRQVLIGEDSKPRIDAVVSNTSINTVHNIEVTALVYESNGNAIAASQTKIDALAKDESKNITFTWPTVWQTRFASCTIPADIMIVLDRSGSMKSDGANPPQPLTEVKNAASAFVNKLTATDRSGVVSFATNASNPIDQMLSNNFTLVNSAINKISIGTSTEQNTNIGDGILKAEAELEKDSAAVGADGAARKVIVLLTDGVATDPKQNGNTKYPEEYAALAASAAKEHGTQIYTIGLGGSVNSDFLQQISSGSGYYFPAADSGVLKLIYQQIATSLCKKGPTILEIIPIVVPE